MWLYWMGGEREGWETRAKFLRPVIVVGHKVVKAADALVSSLEKMRRTTVWILISKPRVRRSATPVGQPKSGLLFLPNW